MGEPANRVGRQVVLVPVKAFARAKLRLAPALTPQARARLARDMATRVVRSAGALPVAVVCDDDEVAEWATGLRALVLWEAGRGLNGAVHDGVTRLRQLGAEMVTVAAGDLPLATDLGWVAGFSGVTIVPDRHHDGTNVIAVPTATTFQFSYGPGSFARHLDEARRAGLPIRVVHSSPLAWDVDVPADLAAVRV